MKMDLSTSGMFPNLKCGSSTPFRQPNTLLENTKVMILKQGKQKRKYGLHSRKSATTAHTLMIPDLLWPRSCSAQLRRPWQLLEMVVKSLFLISVKRNLVWTCRYVSDVGIVICTSVKKWTKRNNYCNVIESNLASWVIIRRQPWSL